MRTLGIVILGILLSYTAVNAQFGFAAKYNSNSYGAFNDFRERVFNDSEKAFSSDIELSANYWFILKETRIEFLPEVHYNLSSSDQLIIPDLLAVDHSIQKIGFNFNTHIYFMDLANDCDCPTFSKDGSGLEKAIHLILSPGLVYANQGVDIADQNQNYSNSSLAYKLGAGLGFDIGFSDLLTITPFFTINYSSSFSADALREFMLDYLAVSSFAPEDSSNFHTQIGIRVGLRPDYVKGR